ncbi:hypothetical protein DB88DRAFT_473228 [Papiliotrema laurentii]|uniref:Uncharacterized protein n=1 Tax=Papiliotrema laurentii TaxID=5418 RepID=A0AAD9D014_PAPLA|nr:hypothetical protein DB88DRAFT_473228 [Papiliotrema laurentii]
MLTTSPESRAESVSRACSSPLRVLSPAIRISSKAFGLTISASCAVSSAVLLRQTFRAPRSSPITRRPDSRQARHHLLPSIEHRGNSDIFPVRSRPRGMIAPSIGPRHVEKACELIAIYATAHVEGMLTPVWITISGGSRAFDSANPLTYSALYT